MAAVGSAKSTSLRQAYKTRPGAGAPSVPLTLEEARCPVCSEILLEPVTMPCGHSVCLHCFQRTVKLISLCCPLCRLRVSSWARKQSREKSLVNTELWELVRLSHPERCKRRMEQRDGETADDEIFRAPVPIHKSGVMCQECDKLKIKGGASEDTEERKKKHPLHRMDDCGMLKHCQYPFCGVSDAENEEPIGKRTRHVSAFVRKTSCLHSSAVQRSRSCTDSEDGRGKNRGHAHPTVPEKANITHSYNAGILLSSENSRSFSAPVFSLDKRHHWRGVHTSSATLRLQTKPERSISPESNDSISEELNHFKPIVCSPCTPPKRLPDGQLLEPTIVKSTPRNLARSLHKSTSYEASPTILQKWKQIEVDRQCIKVTSKGTITSPIAEECLKLRTVKERDFQPCNCVVAKDVLQDHHCMCHASTEQSKNRKEMPVLWNKRRLVFDQCNKEEGTQPAGALTKSTTQTIADKSTPKWNSRFESICKYGPSGASYQMLDKHVGHCNQGTIDPVNLINDPTTRSCEFNRPTSRRGKKRSHKTKHLEETVQSKISRIHCCNACDRFDDLFVRRINQEKEDRELALKLQRQFDRERQKVDRHKTSRNKYVLRSWATKDVTVEHNTRRSDRISKRNEHFNCSC